MHMGRREAKRKREREQRERGKGSKEKEGKEERRGHSELKVSKREMECKQRCVTRIKVGNF